MLNDCAACENLRAKNKPCWRHKDAALEPLVKGDPGLGRVTVPTSFYGAQPVRYPAVSYPAAPPSAPPFPLPVGTVLQGPGTTWEIKSSHTGVYPGGAGGKGYYDVYSRQFGNGVIAHDDVVNGSYPVVQVPAAAAAPAGSAPMPDPLPLGAVLHEAATGRDWEVVGVSLRGGGPSTGHRHNYKVAPHGTATATAGQFPTTCYGDFIDRGMVALKAAVPVFSPVKVGLTYAFPTAPVGAQIQGAGGAGPVWTVTAPGRANSSGTRGYDVTTPGIAPPGFITQDDIDAGMWEWLPAPAASASAPSPIVKSILASLNQPPGALPVGTVLRSVHSPKGLGDWVVLSAKKDAAGDFEYEVNEAVNPTPGTGVIHQADIDAGDWTVVP